MEALFIACEPGIGTYLVQGKMGNVVFSLVAMCPTTPWELHYQKEEAEIGYWETSFPTASVLGRRGLKHGTLCRELGGF